MKTSKLKLRLATIYLFLATIAVSVNAQGQGQNCQKNAGKANCENFIPDLSDEQKNSIADLRTSHLKAMNDNKAELSVLKAELRQLEITDPINQNKIEAKIDELMAVKAKMMKQSSKHRQEVRKLLTTEQKAVFDAHVGKRMGHGPHQGKQGKGKGAPCRAQG